MALNVGIHALMRGAMSDRNGTMEVARKAEAFGFSHIGVNDHVVVPTDINSRYPYTEHGQWPGKAFGECLELISTLSFLAGCTSRIRLLTSVMVVPYRPAVLTAKMLATADVLSNGRVIVGCGVGWMPEEFAALGAPDFSARGKATDEFLDAFVELWTKAAPSYHGEHVRFEGITFMPKPVQKPMPLWIGGESQVALRRTARIGTGWYPASNNPNWPLDTPARMADAVDKLRRACQQAGRDPDDVEVGHLTLWPVSWVAEKTADGGRKFITGSSAEIADDLVAMAGGGVQHVSLMFQAATTIETIERMQRFAEEVMPSIR
jgi:probable F420-dependent oxidoreductase